jgi:hypothetical protein
MTQSSDEVKSVIAETLVSLRDSFAKAEFHFGNSFATNTSFILATAQAKNPNVA